MATSTCDVDRHWMRRALALAEHAATLDEVPVGAVVVRAGVELGAGWNNAISTHDPTAHAEVNALRAASKKTGNYRLPGSTLYVTVEPCAMCAGAVVQARVARVVFAAPEPRSGAVVSVLRVFDCEALNHRPEVAAGVMREEASQTLRRLFRARRANSGTVY